MNIRTEILRAALAFSAATFLSAALAQTPGSSTAGVQGGVGPGTPSSTAGNSTNRTAAGATGAGGSTAADQAGSTAGSAGASGGVQPGMTSMSQGAPRAGVDAAAGATTASGTGDHTFAGWIREHSLRSNGRISRQAYMDEAARRWDAADATHQGLTSDEINRMYGWSSGYGTTENVTGPRGANSSTRETRSQ